MQTQPSGGHRNVCLDDDIICPLAFVAAVLCGVILAAVLVGLAVNHRTGQLTDEIAQWQHRAGNATAQYADCQAALGRAGELARQRIKELAAAAERIAELEKPPVNTVRRPTFQHLVFRVSCVCTDIAVLIADTLYWWCTGAFFVA